MTERSWFDELCVVSATAYWTVRAKSHCLLFIVVHHVQGPTSSNEAPNPYVKMYLLPDPLKLTKKKTKIAKNSYNPTYNEMVSLPQLWSAARHSTIIISVAAGSLLPFRIFFFFNSFSVIKSSPRSFLTRQLAFEFLNYTWRFYIGWIF